MPQRIEIKGLKVSSSHFLVGHPKCSRLHGHNYYISVVVIGPVDKKGFIIDFSVLKKVILDIVEPMDHRVLLPKFSPDITYSPIELSGCPVYYIFVRKKLYVLPVEDICFLPIVATTAELLSKYLYLRLKSFYHNLEFKVSVSETKGASGSFELDDDNMAEILGLVRTLKSKTKGVATS